MSTVTFVEAKTYLSKLLDQVEAGEEIVITRHGRAVARISAIARPREPIPSLAEFRARMQPLGISSAALIREMRDEGY